MPAFREGKVLELVEQRRGLIRARVELAGGEMLASAYPQLLGPLETGDRVVVNTTGVDLGLGTGGEGFILWNLDRGDADLGEGHIVKLRYTGLQTEVLAVEAPESEHHAVLAENIDLDGTPVIACGLHSQIAGVAAGIKSALPDARVAYVMSDGGALALPWSNLVHQLGESNLIDVTCTYGHAFGGAIEAVNVFSALVAARAVGAADAIVVSMGPGGVGTGTRLGFSGIEQGQVLDAAGALGGKAIACVRVSFDDPRERHEGISHHGITTLQVATARRATVVLPTLTPERSTVLRLQCERAGIAGRHEVVETDGSRGVELLKERGFNPATMGRTLNDSPEPFLAAAAAGAVAAGTIS